MLLQWLWLIFAQANLTWIYISEWLIWWWLQIFPNNTNKSISKFCITIIIAGKFGEFGELSVIHQTKAIQISNNLLADLLIHLTFFCQKLKKNQFTKLSHYTVYNII